MEIPTDSVLQTSFVKQNTIWQKLGIILSCDLHNFLRME